jgi:hypothetical protein
MTSFLVGLIIGFAIDHTFMGGANTRLVVSSVKSIVAVIKRKADDLLVNLRGPAGPLH